MNELVDALREIALSPNKYPRVQIGLTVSVAANYMELLEKVLETALKAEKYGYLTPHPGSKIGAKVDVVIALRAAEEFRDLGQEIEL